MLFQIGQKVRLKHTGEVGIVVWIWQANEYGDIDTYVAFFGNEFPKDKPTQVPYVIRYYESSLEALDDKN